MIVRVGARYFMEEHHDSEIVHKTAFGGAFDSGSTFEIVC